MPKSADLISCVIDNLLYFSVFIWYFSLGDVMKYLLRFRFVILSFDILIQFQSRRIFRLTRRMSFCCFDFPFVHKCLYSYVSNFRVIITTFFCKGKSFLFEYLLHLRIPHYSLFGKI